ncbi:MAG: hypothetical protein U9Q30_01380 [Campylobacterota bacterium]|nr:hypothetical protein [Campylobacterota bacterium]
MFDKNKKQYINIIHKDKHLTVESQLLKNNKLIDSQKSSFHSLDDIMSQDTVIKLELLQNKVFNTYISTLYEANQEILKTEEIDSKKQHSIKLTDKYSITTSKDNVSKILEYYKFSGVDYLISPFSILYNNIQEIVKYSSLNVMVHNNLVYIIIFDKNGDITKSFIKELTPFDKLKDSDFSHNNEVVDQKLYEEIYFFELQDIITETVEKHYEEINEENLEPDFFNVINIFYTVKQLTDEQLEQIYETIMVDIKYLPISLEDDLNKFIKDDTLKEHSFIKPRVKKKSNKLFLWSVLLVSSIALIISILYYQLEQKDEIEENKSSIKMEDLEKKVETNNIIDKKIVSKDINKTEKTIVKFTLPDHIKNNNLIEEKIIMLFDLVPYDSVLLNLNIDKNSSTFITNFLLDSKSVSKFQNKLSSLYENSIVEFEKNNKTVKNMIISNSNYIVKNSNSIKDVIYPKYKFIPIMKFTQYLNTILTDNSDIKYISTDIGEYTTIKYRIKDYYKTPNNFFKFINNLNKKDIAIHINYPISFVKLDGQLEVSFDISFYQKNEK